MLPVPVKASVIVSRPTIELTQDVLVVDLEQWMYHSL